MIREIVGWVFFLIAVPLPVIGSIAWIVWCLSDTPPIRRDDHNG